MATIETKVQERAEPLTLLDEAPAAAQPLVVIPELTQETVLLQVISRAAADKSIDLDRMERLLGMQKEIAAKRAEGEFIAAMTTFKKNAPRILKEKLVEFPHSDGAGQTSYKHATLGAVCDAVIAGLAEVGISHAWEPQQLEGGRIQITCILTHLGGHSTRTTLAGPPDSTGKKNTLQQLASASTYLQRYTLLMATGMATHDMDDDAITAGGQSEPTISETQVLDLMALISEVGANKDKLLTYLKVEKLEDIYADNFSTVVKLLEAKRRRPA